MQCHIEIFWNGKWITAAVATFSDQVMRGFRQSGSSFEYDLDYAFELGAPSVSLRFPVNAIMRTLEEWPPFLFDLVPQGAGRRFLLDRLRLVDSPAADVPLMLAGAFNPIGQLRIREAVEYFSEHTAQYDFIRKGYTIEQLLERDDSFLESMMVHGMLASGGTGVQGVAPKYLLTQAKDGLWYPDAALNDDQAALHCIVKRPRGNTEADLKVLRNEKPYMDVASALGIRTHSRLELHGDLLFIPRFDRFVSDGAVGRLAQESVASLAGLSGFVGSSNQFDLLKAIQETVTDPTTETIEFIKRDILNRALRNPDNHARNTAVQIIEGVAKLTPLFDFAPMYLDPEGITRAARWYAGEPRREIQNWQDILPLVAIDDANLLISALRDFARLLKTAPDLMRNFGVDEDVTLFVMQSVAEQVRQLSELGE